MKHFLWSLVLVFMAAAPAWSKPNFVSINRPPSTSGGTLLFGIGDTEDSVAVGVSGFCTVRFEQASGDDVSLYAVTSQSTAAASGTLLKAFTSSTSPSNPAYTFTASTQWVKAKAVDATAGGSKLIIECNPTFGSSGGGGGGSFDACRSGQTQGGGYSSTDGRWAWTCGNYPWREWQDATAANSASYTVECTGDGTPHTSCFRSGETRYIGYGLNVSVAAQYTRDGGRVYLPEGVYTDNGAGDNAAGQPTDFPHPYDPEWEARSDFASLGYPSALRIILLNRGVRLVGEGVPTAVTSDTSDATVTIHRPKLGGTWIMDDRGIANASTASAGSTQGGAGENIEPPAYYRMLVGGNPYTSFCHTTSDTDPTCIVNDTTDSYELAQDAPNGANAWGVDFSLIADFDSVSGTACIPDSTSSLGTTQLDAIGTCSNNRMIRCWDDDDADEPRSTGGCNFGAGGSFGACEAPFEALQTDYVTNSKDYQLAMMLTECTDDATSNADCGSPLGLDLYINDLRSAPGAAIAGASCAAGNGTLVTLGNAYHTGGNDLWANAIPFRNFYIGGTTATNRIFPIKRGAMDGKGAGFENIGRMPANWLTRDSATAAADCLSGGTIGESDDEVQCDTDTLSAFAMSYNNLIGPNNMFYRASQYNGKSAVVETYPSGGPNNFIGNLIDTHYRQVVIDWGEGIIGYNRAQNLSAWTTKYGWLACFGGRCHAEGNQIDNSPLSYGYLGYTAAQEMTVKNEVYTNVVVDQPFFWINGTKNVDIENIDFVHTYYNALAKINPGGASKQKPTVRMADIRADMNFVGVASSTTSATGQPVAAIVVESDAAADSRTDDFKSLILERINLKSFTDDMCLLWIEDDRYTSGGAGGAADTAALTREAASRIIVKDSNLRGSGGGSDNPRIACTGQYRYIASVKDADDSDSWAVEAYAPTLLNNKVNNAPEPNMLPTVSEATLGLANTYPDGTEVRVHDVAAACAHVGGNLTSGANVLTCVSDQGTNAWAAK